MELVRSITHRLVENGSQIAAQKAIISAYETPTNFVLLIGRRAAALALPATAKTLVEMKDAQGKSVGTVILWQKGSGVALKLNLRDLPPGEHAIHFHAVAKCDGPDFKSAGGHFNPSAKKHGFEIPTATTPAT